MWFCYGCGINKSRLEVHSIVSEKDVYDHSGKFRFQVLTRKHENIVFKTFPLYIAFTKSCVFGDPFHRVDVRSIHKEIVTFSNKRIRANRV